jgi:hypothetical protein
MLIPRQQFIVDVFWGSDQNHVAYTGGAEPLGPDDPIVLHLVISDEAQAQILLAYHHPTEVVLAYEVDVGFYRINAERPESLQTCD